MQFNLKTGLRGRVLPALTLGLTTLALLPATLASAQDAQPGAASVRRLTVTGQGEIKVQPDTAVITLGVVTQDKSSQAAVRANAEASQKVQEAIKNAGIADKDVQTANYSVEPVYSSPMAGFGGGGFGGGGTFIDPQGNVVNGNAQDNNADPARPVRPQQPTIVGYRVYNQVRVTVHEIPKLSQVIDAAANAGSNTIEGIGFTRENPEEFENQAMEKAVADARRKADHLAKAAGVTILGVYEINEGGLSRPFPMMAMARAGTATPVQPGEINVTANVTIVYQIGGQGAARADNGAHRAMQARSKTARLRTARR